MVFLFLPNVAVDDIEEGKGADEELCLLPDEEREISDADRERAMQNQKQADETEENEQESEFNDLEAIDENGECAAVKLANLDK